MGTLVFQATLGGAINLIGPNTASTVNFTLPSADGTSGQALTTNGSGVLAFTSVTTAPGGSTTQVQYNNAGAFAGSANLTFNGTTLTAANTSITTSETLSYGTANGVTYLNGSKVLTSGTALQFDGTNMGLGVTPSAWSSSRSKIQFSSAGTVAGFVGCYDGSGANNPMGFGSNAYLSGSGWIYNNTGAASYFSATNGTFQWNTATSGTAGNAITFTQSLALGKGTSLALEGATSQTGTGITFPATQSASSDANTLDDYEEGTWTPTDGSGASLSFTSVTANYTKIGNQVTAWCRLTYPTTASTAGAQLNGLPFVVSSTLSAAGGGMMAYKTTTSVFSIRATGSGILFQDSTGGQPTNVALSTGTFIFATTYFV
jgi:hypothetical protein